MVSLEKEKKEGSFTSQLTGSQSESVNKQEFVNNLLTRRFKSELQRIRKDQLERVNEIAEKHGRRSFAEVLDLLLFCYDFIEDVGERYNLAGIATTIEYINENLPQCEAEIIAREVISLLEKLNLNDPMLEKTLVSILFSVKLKGKNVRDICKLVMEGL